MLEAICRRWWVHLVRGLAAIALALCAIVWPGITLLALVFIFAAFAIIDGAMSILIGIRGEADGSVWWTMVLLGVLSIAAGIIAFAWPELTLVVFLAIAAALAIVRGILEIVAAVRLRKEIQGEWLLALSGALSIVFGGLLIYRPDVGLVVLAILFGAYMMALGILSVALSLRLRNICHSLAVHGRARASAT
jgi:uncharacterized membrane protein HdeD (DUF308 family)